MSVEMLADCKTVAEMMVVISVSSVAEEGGFSLQNKIQQEKLSGKNIGSAATSHDAFHYAQPSTQQVI